MPDLYFPMGKTLERNDIFKFILNGYNNNVDPNTVTTFGVYHVALTSHSPSGSNEYGMLLVLNAGTQAVAQLFLNSSNNLYYRYRNTDTWLSWKQA